MGNTEISEKPSSFPSLTGIRGIAALWVVLFHINRAVPDDSVLGWIDKSSFAANGFRGVDLFFVLSGFIMMHVHAADFHVIRRSMLLHFALMRVTRIYPVHLVVLLLIFVVVLLVPNYAAWVQEQGLMMNTPTYTHMGFWQTAALANRWLIQDHGTWNEPTWSLSVEFLAYTSLPLLAYGLNRVRSPFVCAGVAFGSLATMVLILLAGDNLDGSASNHAGVIRAFGGFAAGAAMCRFVAVARVSDRQVKIAALAAVGLGAALMLTPTFAILLPFSFAILIPTLAYRVGIVDRLLSGRFAMFFGKISFSLYLVHFTPLILLEWALRSGRLSPTPIVEAVSLVGYGILVVAASMLLHHGVERRCQRWGRQIILQRTVLQGSGMWMG